MSVNALRAAIALAAAAFLVAACEPKAPERPDFRAALDAHLATIAARDIDAYKATITNGDDLVLILPDGAALQSTQAVVDFHQGWFEDDQWRFEPEVVHTIEGEDMAAALLKHDYRDTPEGDPRSSWLVLVFKIENSEWRLVHDQNTRIVETTETGE